MPEHAVKRAGQGSGRFGPAKMATVFALMLAPIACGCPERAHVVSPTAAESVERIVTSELDDLHLAAATGDKARYLGHFDRGAVFLGTDRTERWDLPTLTRYVDAHFKAGQGWRYTSKRRAVSFSEDRSLAWFDEDLVGEKAGETRGSGVLVRRGPRYLVVQYNLAATIPNERFFEVQTLVSSPAANKPVTFDERNRRAYESAVAEAEKGDLPRATSLLGSLVPEAKALPGKDSEFWLHNQLTWLAWASGDIERALAEVEAAKLSVDHGTLGEDDRAKLRLHERWDRAYLLLDRWTRTPSQTAATAADQARAAYDLLAKERGDAEGAAVLHAFFLLRRGRAKDAVAAAKKVKLDERDDVQDLYVAVLAFKANRDEADAARVLARICSAKPYLMKPLVSQLLRERARSARSPRSKRLGAARATTRYSFAALATPAAFISSKVLRRLGR